MTTESLHPDFLTCNQSPGFGKVWGWGGGLEATCYSSTCTQAIWQTPLHPGLTFAHLHHTPLLPWWPLEPSVRRIWDVLSGWRAWGKQRGTSRNWAAFIGDWELRGSREFVHKALWGSKWHLVITVLCIYFGTHKGRNISQSIAMVPFVKDETFSAAWCTVLGHVTVSCTAFLHGRHQRCSKTLEGGLPTIALATNKQLASNNEMVFFKIRLFCCSYLFIKEKNKTTYVLSCVWVTFSYILYCRGFAVYSFLWLECILTRINKLLK